MHKIKKAFFSFLFIITNNCYTTPIQFLHDTNEQEEYTIKDANTSIIESNTVEPLHEMNSELEEYDQEICDYTEQSKVSEYTAWLRLIAISCFLKLLETKEYISDNAKNYSQKIQKWLLTFYSKKTTPHKNLKHYVARK